MLHLFSKIAYAAFLILFALVCTLFLVSFLPIPGNIEIRIVQSGSMEPEIRTGSIVILRPVDTYEINDIVTFQTGDSDVPTTHRIVDSQLSRGELRFETKGDANGDADRQLIDPEDIIGKVFFSVPFLGYLLDFVKKPLGFAIVIGVPALLIVFDEIGTIIRELKSMRRKNGIVDETTYADAEITKTK